MQSANEEVRVRFNSDNFDNFRLYIVDALWSYLGQSWNDIAILPFLTDKKKLLRKNLLNFMGIILNEFVISLTQWVVYMYTLFRTYMWLHRKDLLIRNGKNTHFYMVQKDLSSLKSKSTKYGWHWMESDDNNTSSGSVLVYQVKKKREKKYLLKFGRLISSKRFRRPRLYC